MSVLRLRDLACSRSEGDAMLNSMTILIFDSDGYSSLDLSEAIEESKGCVAGPVATLPEALTILDSADVGGAIVDGELPEAADVVMLLTERDVPVVIQTSVALPQPLADRTDLGERASVLTRPVDPRTILETLLIQVGRSELQASNKLDCSLKEV
jgi:hypothetical protein